MSQPPGEAWLPLEDSELRSDPEAVAASPQGSLGQTAAVPLDCCHSLCRDAASGAFSFYTRGEQFEALPQVGQGPWPPEVQAV